MAYTGEDVRREAEEYREWARQRDREQFKETVAARLIAISEARAQELKAEKRHE